MLARKTSPLYLVLDLETICPAEFADVRTEKKFPPPPCHQIICAGYAWVEKHRVLDWGVLGDQGEGERQILLTLTQSIAQADPTIVGMNSRSFDMPVVASRCLRHGIPFPWYYATKYPRYRYSDNKHLDLMDQLCDMGASPRTSLDVWARTVGFPGKMGINGGDVESLYNRGNHQAVADYCMTDVAQTIAILFRYDLLCGALAPSVYDAAASTLLRRLERDPRTAGLAARVDRDLFLLRQTEAPRPPPHPEPCLVLDVTARVPESELL